MPDAPDPFAAFQPLLEQVLVVDMQEPVVYIGRLVDVNSVFLTLADADIHECTGTGSRTKEVYAMEARANGIHPSRTRVRVLLRHVLSVSRLDEVIQY